jgi:riboflavin synthase
MNYLGQMFTGIIETTGIVTEVILTGSNRTFWIEAPISNQLKIDQSVSHSGVCLTVEEIKENSHRVTAVDETLKKTNLGSWQKASIVNLERCLKINDRLDGHLVQGHTDATGVCVKKNNKAGSWLYVFEFPKKFASLIIEKGSICINGISLTAFDVKKDRFSVTIIPYTFENTNIQAIKKNDTVNLEFDMLGKYIVRNLSLKK